MRSTLQAFAPGAALLAAVVIALCPGSARAQRSREFRYTYGQLWRSAVRLIAVNYRYRIPDKDDEIGYILFAYEERGQSHQGSLELVKLGDESKAPVRVAIRVPTRPGYVAQMMLDRLRRKLLADYGAEPREGPGAAPGDGVKDDDSDSPAPSEEERNEQPPAP